MRISSSICVYLWHDDGTKPMKLTGDKQLKKLINMWYDNQVDMSPGEFITRVTGNKCYDIT